MPWSSCPGMFLTCTSQHYSLDLQSSFLSLSLLALPAGTVASHGSPFLSQWSPCFQKQPRDFDNLFFQGRPSRWFHTHHISYLEKLAMLLMCVRHYAKCYGSARNKMTVPTLWEYFSLIKGRDIVFCSNFINHCFRVLNGASLVLTMNLYDIMV